MSAEPVRPTAVPAASPIALMLCPLCFGESGRRVAIVAEYAVRSASVVTVAHLVGCEHGARFAQAGALTFAERYRLTRAALAMWDAERRDAAGQGSRLAGPGLGDLPTSAPLTPGLVSCRNRAIGCRAERAEPSLRRGHRAPR